MLRGGLATAIRKVWQRHVEYIGKDLVCILLFTVIGICIFIPIVRFRVMIMKNTISIIVKRFCFIFIFILVAVVIILIDISIALFIDIGASLILFILTYISECVYSIY